MKHYLLSLLFVSSLIAGTYDDPYVVSNKVKGATEKQDRFMNGEFLEIKRFDSLQFHSGMLSKDSQHDFQDIVSTINKYTEEKKNIVIKIIGHSSLKTDIYNKALVDAQAYLKSIQESEIFAKTVVKNLEDNNISKDLLHLEYRASHDSSYTNTTQESKDLSNRVMVTMYVLARKDEDSDKDGVFNSKDDCPNTPVGVKVDEKGCPLDSDKDGILDYLDECPDTPIGVEVDERGCPFDSDQDGVLDYKDKCPDTIHGLKVDADGCPISRELRLNFTTKSSKIISEVYSQVTEFAEFLQENPSYKARIVGHTDSVGKAGDNMRLSFDRAHSVKSALQTEGVHSERLEAVGRGELSPLETNRTAKGRATNRRIEIKLFN
ncbi:MAG: outer membrane protein OmpA-like peptidoglycan-associated protein [Sulfurimonas sp.]|jgi:outer membrane protein OmpA-like peptidoglycan-associated protein|uniref:OmpA family protein n=1 Tax=Sulfurimonas sp. TaxID=2022749 RepID=UPI0039E5CA57